MITLVVTTHGQLADGFLDAVELIVGPQTNLYSVCLKAGDSFDEFQQNVAKHSIEGKVLYFTDLLGASPYNAVAQTISENREKEIACITGVNLPLLIEAIFKREELTLKELTDYLVNIGKDGITALAFQ